ncbi:MAG TPA: Uma2 family endonuclease [Pyrinomonadaceae bacterium]|nr:Uma2 family endonuclease [Pyrinomonadaceae bacterium]
MATQRKDLLSHYFSLDEYFALEHAGHVRYEYWDGEIVCMSGGSIAYSQIVSNIHYRLRQGVEGGPCRAFTSELPIKTPTLPPYRYPDASVACSELHYENIRGIDVLLNPVLIVEVLSPTSAERDREDKFAAYQAIPSFGEYLLVAPETPHVVHYVRQSEGGWGRSEARSLGASLGLVSINRTLAMSDVYEDVAFA